MQAPSASTPQPATTPPQANTLQDFKRQKLIDAETAKQQARIDAKKPTYDVASAKVKTTKAKTDDALAVVDQILKTPDAVGETSTDIWGNSLSVEAIRAIFRRRSTH